MSGLLKESLSPPPSFHMDLSANHLPHGYKNDITKINKKLSDRFLFSWPQNSRLLKWQHYSKLPSSTSLVTFSLVSLHSHLIFQPYQNYLNHPACTYHFKPFHFSCPAAFIWNTLSLCPLGKYKLIIITTIILYVKTCQIPLHINNCFFPFPWKYTLLLKSLQCFDTTLVFIYWILPTRW